MTLPKITFKAMSFIENMDLIAMFINNELNNEQKPNTYFFINHYPELKNINFSKCKTTEEISELLQFILFDSWNKDMENSDIRIREIQKDWNMINNDVMLDLSKRLNIKWPKDSLNIKARVGIMFYCPRYINQRTFNLNIKFNTSTMRSIILHEITHFLYFEKWKELYNDYDESHYNIPHIIWYLSEAIIEPLLNNCTFRKYTLQENKSNRDMSEIIVDNKSIVETLNNIFTNSSGVEEAIKKGYSYFLKNEKLIKKIK